MRTRQLTRGWAGLVLLCRMMIVLRAAEGPGTPTPPFEEVYGLVRSNLAGATDSDLNRAALMGFLRQLQAQVSLVTNAPGKTEISEIPLVSKTAVFDGAYGFIRVGRVGAGLPEEFKQTYSRLASTNKLKGLVLDLRYALGQEYTAAAETADLFFKSEQPLLQLGTTTVKSKAKTDAIELPLVVLINHDTMGAAEALVAALREAEGTLIIGSSSAGQAHVYKDFPLSTGEVLRVASVPVATGGGTRLPEAGLTPDIRITVNPAEEKGYFEDPYKMLTRPFAQAARPSSNDSTSLQSTNRNRRRLNEAELVRMQRDGLDLDMENIAPSPPQASGAVLTDPALSRGLDLLKGLALSAKRR